MNDYITTDIYLAATLSALDFVLEEITEEGNKFLFHFINPQDPKPTLEIMDIEAEEYWTGNLLVDPKKLFSEFNEIKARMYDLRRSRNAQSTT